MNSESQREALAMLAEVWSLSPDVRLGQLFAHLGFLGENHIGRGLWDIEDDELMRILALHRTELLARLQNTPESNAKCSASVVEAAHSKSPISGSHDR
jgi:hypothetical protein